MPRDDAGGAARQDVAALALVLLPSAAGHSLSVGTFRWLYDGNPLSILALAMLASVLVASVDRRLTPPAASDPAARRAASRLASLLVTLLAAGLCALNPHLPRLFKQVREATQTWPEIDYLRGARLPPRGAPLRRVVARVRELAGPQEEVLLLPEDPNVEAFIDRPRPKLTSAIVFTDQYWPRYVAADLATLTARPPKVVILGPRHFYDVWSALTRGWGGADRRLFDALAPLLRERYTLDRSASIFHPGLTSGEGEPRDTLDVYVRREP